VTAKAHGLMVAPGDAGVKTIKSPRFSGPQSTVPVPTGDQKLGTGKPRRQCGAALLLTIKSVTVDR
jgi:hypothetical protein